MQISSQKQSEIRFSKLEMVQQLIGNIESAEPSQIVYQYFRIDDIFNKFTRNRNGEKEKIRFKLDLDSLSCALANVCLQSDSKTLDENKLEKVSSWLTNPLLIRNQLLSHADKIRNDSLVQIKAFWNQFVNQEKVTDDEFGKEKFQHLVANRILRYGQLKKGRGSALKKKPDRILGLRVMHNPELERVNKQRRQIDKENEQLIADFINQNYPESLSKFKVKFQSYSEKELIQSYLTFDEEDGMFTVTALVDENQIYLYHNHEFHDEGQQYLRGLLQTTANDAAFSFFVDGLQQCGFNIQYVPRNEDDQTFENEGKDPNYGNNESHKLLITHENLKELKLEVPRITVQLSTGIQLDQATTLSDQISDFTISILGEIRSFSENYKSNAALAHLPYNFDFILDSERTTYLQSIVLHRIFHEIEEIVIHDGQLYGQDSVSRDGKQWMFNLQKVVFEGSSSLEVQALLAQCLVEQLANEISEAIKDKDQQGEVVSLIDLAEFQQIISILNLDRAIKYFKNSIKSLELGLSFQIDLSEFKSKISEIVTKKAQNQDSGFEAKEFHEVIQSIIQLPITILNLTESLRILGAIFPKYLNTIKNLKFSFVWEKQDTFQILPSQKSNSVIQVNIWRTLPPSRQECLKQLSQLLKIPKNIRLNNIPLTGLRLYPLTQLPLIELTHDTLDFTLRRTYNYRSIVLPPKLPDNEISFYLIKQATSENIRLKIDGQYSESQKFGVNVHFEKLQPGLYTICGVACDYKILFMRDVFVKLQDFLNDQSFIKQALYDYKNTENLNQSYLIVNQHAKYGLYEPLNIQKTRSFFSRKQPVREPKFGETNEFSNCRKIRFINDIDILWRIRDSNKNKVCIMKCQSKYHENYHSFFIKREDDLKESFERKVIQKYQLKVPEDNELKNLFRNFIYVKKRGPMIEGS